MAIVCVNCGRDLNRINQNNMSSKPNYPLCEDCYDLSGDENEEYRQIEWEARFRCAVTRKQLLFLLKYTKIKTNTIISLSQQNAQELIGKIIETRKKKRY